MKRIERSLKGNSGTIYPPFRGGNRYVENLTTYREDFRLLFGAIIDDFLAFDIEKYVSWDKQYNLMPFMYSMMIDGCYPISRLSFLGKKSKPTREEFVKRACQLHGFVLDEEVTSRGFLTYVNRERNISINWDDKSNSVPKLGRDKICIGVIQANPVPELQTVTNEIIPYAVSIFNQLSPTRKIDQYIVNESIRLAFESDKILPRCRVNQ